MCTDCDCMVSVFCTAYNHEQYIAHALDSFLRQKTAFPFEIIVTDDASTDGTTEIIRSYAEKHPDIIRFFHQDQNRFSKGVNIYEEVMYPNARGKYVAYCEGDDFWCDDSKLQMQVDFLESHPDYSACVHNTYYYFCSTGESSQLVIPVSEDRDVTFSAIISGMSHCFHTSSILGRADLLCNPPDFQRVAFETAGFTDYALSLWLRLNGKIRFIEKPMSIYRVNSNPASWKSGYDFSYEKKIRFVKGEIAMMQTLIPHLTDKEFLSQTEVELLKRKYELLYLEGKVREMVAPPYRSLYKKEPFLFKFKTTLKLIFPAFHKAYRNRKKYH